MEWFKMQTGWGAAIELMTDEEAGRVMKSIYTFISTGAKETREGMEGVVGLLILNQLEKDMEEFRQKAAQKEELTEKRREAGRRSGEARRAKTKQAQTESDPVPPRSNGSEPVAPCSDAFEDVPARSDLFVPYKNTEPRNTEPRSKNTEPRISETETERETDTEGETKKEEDGSELLTEASELPVETIPLNDGTDYPVYRREADEYARLYPAVDVVQELRKMRGWCMAHPARRKTRRGVKGFINTWLSREQDKGRGREESPLENPFLVYARGEKTEGEIFL
jgi:hypothetical protein